MNPVNEDLARQVGLFRYGLIADVLHLKGRKSGLQTKLEEKSRQTYIIPGSDRTYVAAETIRAWLKDYRSGGFDALLPQRRADVGQCRKLPKAVQDTLLTIKEEHPDFSVGLVIAKARKERLVSDDVPLPPSTVHRLFSRHGLMQKRPTEPTTKDHRRFEYAYAGELWMSDVMHGPLVTVEGLRQRKTYLIAFIDDATRVIPHAVFALSESNIDFMPALKQAILRRGIPKRLFVDNGAAYRSQHLALVMAKLGITLIHARVRHPQAKGKQERWFRRVRSQFLPLLGSRPMTLEALNRQFWRWVENDYHGTPHRGLANETPLERWAATATQVRYPAPDLDQLFLFEARRKVRKDRTVSLDGAYYEVDAMLVDASVTLKFNPADRRVVQVWQEHRRFDDAKLVDTRANCFVQRQVEQPKLRFADLTSHDHEEGC